ncbi:hypothetical protein BV22DRAFT_1132883 [Leucogyrophana mollusca]|uniref:Uncharacterized protein n=1 Tax=Leucogyrophana mollusca TaxID=85980 RepID=A0ACB8B4R8_9AGAM|nr:hypothetical protein BV22DRAFT_1132883 [Leucogyrophana mollusca]
MTFDLPPSIQGWSPSGDEDEDVFILDEPHVSTSPFEPLKLSVATGYSYPFHASATLRRSQPRRSGSNQSPPAPSCFHPSQLLSSSSQLFPSRHSMAPSSDRRAQRNRTRDPSWIPRPRNAFIIFRCEYSREHTQTAHDGDEDHEVVNPTAKTLSKRAAEAWKHLCAAEKDRYKVLADKEREEHAKLYPHYRFRPVRRQISAARRRQYDLPQSTSTSVERTDKQPPYPTPPVMQGQAGDDRAENNWEASEMGVPPLPASQLRETSRPASVATQRRSSSVPLSDSFFLPSAPTPILRDPIRRSKSAAGRTLSPCAPLDHVSRAAYARFGAEGSQAQPWPVVAEPPVALAEPEALFDGFSFEFSGLDYELSQPASDTYPTTAYPSPVQTTNYSALPPHTYSNTTYSTSPLATVASSLIGWNGEFGPPSPSTSGHTRPSSSQGEAHTPAPHGIVTTTVKCSAEAPSSTALAAGDFNPLSGYLPCDGLGSGRDSSYEDLERAQALEAYAIGLHNYDMFTSSLPALEYPDPVLFGPPFDTDFTTMMSDHATKS